MSRRDEDSHSISFDWQNGGFQYYVDVTKVFDSKSFQDGVNTLYNKCVSCGVTPSSKTPTAVSNAIQSIYANRYNEGFNAGQSATTIQTREVSGSQNNFSSYTDYGLDRSVKINPPSLSGYTIIGAYIKKIYVSNTNKAFGSGTFEVMKSGSTYYVISKDCTWPSGGTSVNVTITFIYQKN